MQLSCSNSDEENKFEIDFPSNDKQMYHNKQQSISQPKQPYCKNNLNEEEDSSPNDGEDECEEDQP